MGYRTLLRAQIVGFTRGGGQMVRQEVERPQLAVCCFACIIIPARFVLSGLFLERYILYDCIDECNSASSRFDSGTAVVPFFADYSNIITLPK